MAEPSLGSRTKPGTSASGHKDSRPPKEEKAMLNLLWLIAVFLVVMWILGFALHFTVGGLIHLLLVLAAISVLFRIIMGRRIA
jgi:hypothetical protein